MIYERRAATNYGWLTVRWPGNRTQLARLWVRHLDHYTKRHQKCHGSAFNPTISCPCCCVEILSRSDRRLCKISDYITCSKKFGHNGTLAQNMWWRRDTFMMRYKTINEINANRNHNNSTRRLPQRLNWTNRKTVITLTKLNHFHF